MNHRDEKQPGAKTSHLVEFTVNGITVYTNLTKKYKNRSIWTKPDEKKVLSFIPGTIREVFVKKGDPVRENDKLLILEAMKMMNIIASPVEGRIKDILVNPGDQVPKGQVMVEFE